MNPQNLLLALEPDLGAEMLPASRTYTEEMERLRNCDLDLSVDLHAAASYTSPPQRSGLTISSQYVPPTIPSGLSPLEPHHVAPLAATQQQNQPQRPHSAAPVVAFGRPQLEVFKRAHSSHNLTGRTFLRPASPKQDTELKTSPLCKRPSLPSNTRGSTAQVQRPPLAQASAAHPLQPGLQPNMVSHDIHSGALRQPQPVVSPLQPAGFDIPLNGSSPRVEDYPGVTSVVRLPPCPFLQPPTKTARILDRHDTSAVVRPPHAGPNEILPRNGAVHAEAETPRMRPVPSFMSPAPTSVTPLHLECLRRPDSDESPCVPNSTRGVDGESPKSFNSMAVGNTSLVAETSSLLQSFDDVPLFESLSETSEISARYDWNDAHRLLMTEFRRDFRTFTLNFVPLLEWSVKQVRTLDFNSNRNHRMYRAERDNVPLFIKVVPLATWNSLMESMIRTGGTHMVSGENYVMEAAVSAWLTKSGSEMCPNFLGYCEIPATPLRRWLNAVVGDSVVLISVYYGQNLNSVIRWDPFTFLFYALQTTYERLRHHSQGSVVARSCSLDPAVSLFVSCHAACTC